MADEVIEQQAADVAQPEVAAATSDGAIDEALTPEQVEAQRRTEIRDAAKEVYRGPDYIQRMRERQREKETELRDDLPYDQWAKRREDQLSGKTDERIATAKAFGSEMRAALAGMTAAQMENQQEAPITPAYWESNGQAVGPVSAAQVQQDQETVNGYFEKAEGIGAELSKREDFSELMETADSIAMQPHVTGKILSLQNPRIAWHLAENPGLALRINRMNPDKAWAAIDKIHAELTSGGQRSEAMSNAPEPIRPVRKAGPSASDPAEAGDYKEYVRRRNAQIAARGER